MRDEGRVKQPLAPSVVFHSVWNLNGHSRGSLLQDVTRAPAPDERLGQPRLLDALPSPANGRLVVGAVVPVIRDGRVLYALAGIEAVERLQDLLASTPMDRTRRLPTLLEPWSRESQHRGNRRADHEPRLPASDRVRGAGCVEIRVTGPPQGADLLPQAPSSWLDGGRQRAGADAVRSAVGQGSLPCRRLLATGRAGASGRRSARWWLKLSIARSARGGAPFVRMAPAASAGGVNSAGCRPSKPATCSASRKRHSPTRCAMLAAGPSA